MSYDSLIQTIFSDKMNSFCFDCGSKNVSYVSVNNGIFLCNECAKVHMSFPKEVSLIEKSDLYSLTESALQYLAYGGNTRLNDFILEEFPKLENYSQKLLYKTRAMDYYRKRLNYFVNGGQEPRRPSQIVGCQLIPQNNYNNKNYIKTPINKYEPKTSTYKPEQIKKRPININLRKDKDFGEEDEFMKDPFMGERKFGPSTNMFKNFFGNDFFDDDDFFGFGNKLNQTQRYDDYPSYNYPPQQKPQPKKYNNNTFNINNTNIKEPQDNLSKSLKPDIYVKRTNKRPQTVKGPTYVPSRKDKYIQKNNQNTNYNDDNNKEKYNPFQKRDSTDLIIIPGSSEKEKTKQKTKEIPIEFHKQATGLGQIADTINENEDEYMSDDGSNSSEELERIAKEKEEQRKSEEKEKVNKGNKFYDGSEATFENSVRNKYKKKKTEELEKKLQKEEKLRSTPKNNNINNNINNSNKQNNGSYYKRNSKKMNNGTEKNDVNNGQFNMKKYARRLSKMNISSTNWNINQLGDMNTYPDVMEIEA